ncbi:MAG: biopolymer transport protein ExbD [Hyphomicrobiaceae bacterium]|jgi:biopolymer transport protein ExbD
MEFEGRSQISEQISIAPLIDIVFLLLVFFMLTSTFTKPEAIDLTLPSTQTSAPTDEHPIRISLSVDGEVSLNGEIVEFDQLRPRLIELIGDDVDTAVGLSADAAASVQQMLDVVDEIRAAGGRNLAVVSQHED